MNTNSNTYTIIYSTVMVVIVAAVLAYVSVSLSGKQQANVNTETRQSILSSVNLGQGADKASDKNAYVEQEFNKYITDSYLVDAQGNKVDGDAFSLALTAGLKSQYDIMKQANPDVSKLTLPVFVCTLDDGSKVEIFPIYGETPGLGAEIATPMFSDQFIGKSIFDGSSLVSVTVVKGGAPEGSAHEIDAISGGTITSRALENAIRQWLEYYEPYLEKQKAER